MQSLLSVAIKILFEISVLAFETCALPLMAKDNKYVNPFVGFFVFPHGGITLDPVNTNYSTQPAFNKPDSKKGATNLHEAMKNAADSLIQSNPDLIIFSTPHGFFLADSPLILSTERTYGDAGGIWGDFMASFEIDSDLSAIIYSELKGAHNPINILTLGAGFETAPIFWAEVIPWYFIRDAANRANRNVPPAIYIGQPTRVNPNELNNFGRDIVKTALIRPEFANKRIAVVISGDLSHFHSNDPLSPYPYDPISSVFDSYITNWAKLDRNSKHAEESSDQLLNKAGGIQDRAGHCGYTGFVMLNGMLEEVVNQNWNYKSNFYAYEVPSYFGMMVVSWTPMP